LLLAAGTLAACNQITAEPTAPPRPVLVAAVHYRPQIPDRSFVGTVRPRIESDLGFRVTGKIQKRLVEVGALVVAGSAAGRARRGRPQAASRTGHAEFRAATGVVAQAVAAESRATDLKVKGWSTQAQVEQAKATADEARARLNRAERSVDLTKNSLSYATLMADAPGVVTATLIEPDKWLRPGKPPSGSARLAEKRSGGCDSRNIAGAREIRRGAGLGLVKSDKRYAASSASSHPRPMRQRTYLAKFSISKRTMTCSSA